MFGVFWLVHSLAHLWRGFNKEIRVYIMAHIKVHMVNHCASALSYICRADFLKWYNAG